ncbi:unnamed protein product [Ilex paraguariensis]|uniref:Uncharacterized protein n=1 Tax=Ilex paraguariensis TaxID=185542 RepID=A0ABC8U7Z3_9AQUA
MLRTKSSQSYNPMDQNSNTNPNPAQTSLQQQLYQLSQTVDTVVRRLDVMDVRRHCEELREPRGDRRAPRREEWGEESDREKEDEDLLLTEDIDDTDDDVVMEGVNLEEERLEATTLPSRVIQQVRAR